MLPNVSSTNIIPGFASFEELRKANLSNALKRAQEAKDEGNISNIVIALFEAQQYTPMGIFSPDTQQLWNEYFNTQQLTFLSAIVFEKKQILELNQPLTNLQVNLMMVLLKYDRLRAIKLSGSQVNTDMLKKISLGLSSNRSLDAFEIDLLPSGSVEFVTKILEHPCLTKFKCYNSQFNDDDAVQISGKLAQNESLTYFGIYGHNFKKKGHVALYLGCVENKNWKLEISYTSSRSLLPNIQNTLAAANEMRRDNLELSNMVASLIQTKKHLVSDWQLNDAEKNAWKQYFTLYRAEFLFEFIFNKSNEIYRTHCSQRSCSIDVNPEVTKSLIYILKHDATLKNLKLNYFNVYGKAELDAICETLKTNVFVEELTLESYHNEFHKLSELLAVSKTIKKLDIRAQTKAMDFDSLSMILKAIQNNENKALISLELPGNELSGEDAQEIVKLLQSYANLENLNLSGNNFNFEDLRKIATAAGNHQKLKTLSISHLDINRDQEVTLRDMFTTTKIKVTVSSRYRHRGA